MTSKLQPQPLSTLCLVNDKSVEVLTLGLPYFDEDGDLMVEGMCVTDSINVSWQGKKGEIAKVMLWNKRFDWSPWRITAEGPGPQSVGPD